ncbi:MAG: extracellular solute-binding protein [Planctomycetota bacterium]|nr:MAG: extracellular solute-binding protein [Planctomycetota bacterium]
MERLWSRGLDGDVLRVGLKMRWRRRLVPSRRSRASGPTGTLRQLALAILVAGCLGCVPQPEDAVVVYSAADREYASPIFGAFQRRHPGTEVVPVFDVESTKTVGLVARIEAERDRPRCDVFWNNEIMHTLRLERQGLLQPIGWDIPSDWPADLRAADGSWVGFAMRARILLVNREVLTDPGAYPRSVLELADPKWKGRCAVAEPLAGTTATHFAVLDHVLGPEKAAELFAAIRANAVVLSGNKQVALAVSSGQVAWGLTDTDDGLIERDAGLPVEIVFPDQDPEGLGALRIPNTVCVIRGCPHPRAAAALANFLVSEDIEGRLALGPSGQIPARPGHPQRSRAQGEQEVRWMHVDFHPPAQRWPELAEQLRRLFRGS